MKKPSRVPIVSFIHCCRLCLFYLVLPLRAIRNPESGLTDSGGYVVSSSCHLWTYQRQKNCRAMGNECLWRMHWFCAVFFFAAAYLGAKSIHALNLDQRGEQAEREKIRNSFTAVCGKSIYPLTQCNHCKESIKNSQEYLHRAQG